MKTRFYNAALVAFILGTALFVSTARAADPMRRNCEQAMADFKKADPTLQNTLKSAAGFAVFPGVPRGGVEHSSGCVFQNGRIIGQATMTPATISAQRAGERYAELIVFQNQTALNNFKSSNWEIRAGVSPMAASQGASQRAKSDQGFAVFTLGENGAMAEASVAGQRFWFAPRSMR